MKDRERSRLSEVERAKEYLKNEGIEMVLFDMDSTLVKTSEGFQKHIGVFAEWMAGESGLERKEVHQRFMETIIGLRGEFSVKPEISRVTVETVRRWCGVEESEEFEEVVERLMEMYMDPFEKCDGASGVVDLIAKTGVRMGVVTLAGEAWTRRKIGKYFNGKFEGYYCVDTAGKKDMMAWHRGLGSFGVFPEDVMVVGDSWKSDILPVLDLGVKKVVWVNAREEHHEDERVIEIGGIGELGQVFG